VEAEREFYSKRRVPEENRDWQLDSFNELWTTISQTVPFYAELLRSGKAPSRFKSWEEFRNAFPIADRAFARQRRAELTDPTRVRDFMRTTGGSTSEPIQLQAWKSELDYANADMWLARSWFGIDPGDKLFLIWGHSHQLGRGIPGKINAIRREMKDMILGYSRASAYDLSEEAMRRAGETLLTFRPKWVMAYSVALDQFARANAERAPEFHALNLKAAIASAEAFPRADSATRIEHVLGCPVAMEYGAVETGPIAHQRRDGKFHVFWRHWFVEGATSPNVPGTFDILVTSLYPRKFPLVRYRIGDLISDNPNGPDFDQSFSRVVGRCNDCVQLADGANIHSEAFTHAVRECEGVTAFQVVQNGGGKIFFRYVSAAQQPETEREIRRRLSIVHPELGNVEFERVSSLSSTIAGKTRAVIREEL